MPYRSNSELPSWVKEMPEHAQNIYRKAFNSAYAQYNDDGKAAATAITAVKTKYEKRNGKWVRKRTLNGSDTFAVEPILNGIKLYCVRRNNAVSITMRDGRTDLSNALPSLAEEIAKMFTNGIKSFDGVIVMPGLSKSDTLKALLASEPVTAPYVYHIYDCTTENPNTEWVDRRRDLIKYVKQSPSVKLVDASIVNSADDMLDASGKCMAYNASNGIAIKFSDGAESARTGSISSGVIQLYTYPVFACTVESKKTVNNLNIYKLNKINGYTFPTDLALEDGAQIAVQPVAVRIHGDDTEFIMSRVIKNCDNLSPLSYFDQYRMKGSGVTLNMHERTIESNGTINPMPMEMYMHATCPDGTYNFGVVYWTTVPSFKSYNQASSGIIVEDEHSVKVISGLNNAVNISKSKVRNTEVLCTVEISGSQYRVGMETINKLSGIGYALLENKKRAVKSLVSATDPFLIVDDKPSKWSYKLKTSGDNVTGELFFESNDKVYCMTILNPLDGARDRIFEHQSGDVVTCTRTCVSNAFNFLKHTLSMDESVELKDIITDSTLYDLASKPALWLDFSGTIKYNENTVSFQQISNGTLEHGVKRTDMNEYKFDKIGRVVVLLDADSAGCDKDGNVETLWTFTIPSKMQEWYANTHDINTELSDASSKSYNVIWQAPGVKTQKHFFKE